MQSRWILDRDPSEKRIRICAPAKINFFLKVMRRLDSGYHEIQSLMAPITLSDTITVSVAPEAPENSVTITCDDPSLPGQQDNLAFKAVQIMNKAGIHTGNVSIHIEKRVPSGAGLGGGSSDAAAVFKGIDSLLDLQLSQETLRSLGLKIGSDIPFFFMEQACLVSGIGERLKPVKITHDIWLLIAFPGISISTRKVYQGLDLELTNPDAQVKMPIDLGKGYQRGGTEPWHLVNHLELPVFVWYPFLKEMCDNLRTLGALEARMTGSGSSIFGVFRERAAAAMAMAQLQKESPEWKFYLTRPIWQGEDERWRGTNGSDRGEGFSR